MVLSAFANGRDMSFLIIQNLLTEVLMIIVFRMTKSKMPFNLHFLFISNIIVWFFFALWYCRGNYYNVGISAMPGSHVIRWMFFMSNKLARASHYILFTTIFLSIEYYISTLLEKRFDLQGKLIKSIISICLIVCTVCFLFCGKTIESLLSSGPVTAYAEEYDMHFKAWQMGRKSFEIEVSRPGLKKPALLHVNEEYGTLLLLRHDSIGILPKDGNLGWDVSVVQKGDFCVYDATEDFRKDHGDKHCGQVEIGSNPLEITIFRSR